MIKYDPLWRTLKEKGISQYQLIKDYGIDKAQLQLSLIHIFGTLLSNLRFLNGVNKFRPVISGIFSDSPELSLVHI